MADIIPHHVMCLTITELIVSPKQDVHTKNVLSGILMNLPALLILWMDVHGMHQIAMAHILETGHALELMQRRTNGISGKQNTEVLCN